MAKLLHKLSDAPVDRMRDTKIYKGYDAGLEIKEDERAVIFTINTGSVDRDKEIIEPKGADLSPYRSNPVVMWAHNYHMPPIGRAQWIKKDDNTAIIAKAIFAETELAEQVYSLYKAKPPFLRMASIGFIPKEFKEVNDEELKKHPEWEGAERVCSKWELLEFSCVPIGSNREALAIAVGKGEVDLSDELKKSIGIEDESSTLIIPPKEEVTQAIQAIVEPLMETKERHCCQCVKCGKIITTNKPCKEGKCPDCGEAMREVEKPKEPEPPKEAEDSGEIISIGEGMKPYPNEHACRLADPGQFERFRRQNCGQKHDGKCIDVIFGVKEGKSKIQSLRYKKDVWSAGAARAHCKTRDGKFEAAGSSESAESDRYKALIQKKDREVEVLQGILAEQKSESRKHQCLVLRALAERDKAREMSRKLLAMVGEFIRNITGKIQ